MKTFGTHYFTGTQMQQNIDEKVLDTDYRNTHFKSLFILQYIVIYRIY